MDVPLVVQVLEEQEKEQQQHQRENATKKDININAAKDGDVGAGVAMLGGTSIAEVSLPVEERIRNEWDTETAAARKEAALLAR